MSDDQKKPVDRDPVALEIRDMLDVPMHVWQQLKTWLEQQGMRIPGSQIIGGVGTGGSITPPVTLTGVDPADAVLTLESAPGATDLGNSVFRLKDDAGFERWDIDAAGHSEFRNGTGGHVTVDPNGYVLIGGDGAALLSGGLNALLNVGNTIGGSGGTIQPQLYVAIPDAALGFGVKVQAGLVADASLQISALTDQTGPLLECRDQDFNLVFSIGPTGALTVSVPTADPHVVGEVWNDAGTLKVSAG